MSALPPHDGVGHATHAYHLSHIMHPHDVSTVGDTDGYRSRGTLDTVVGGEVEYHLYHGLARWPDKDRLPQLLQLCQTAQDFDVLLPGLAKAETGVDDDVLAGYSGPQCRFDTVPQRKGHFGNYVFVECGITPGIRVVAALIPLVAH